MTAPDPYHAMRRILLDEASVTSRLLPQASIPGLLVPPIFAYEYPRKVAGIAATDYRGHDWAGLLSQRTVKLILITPSGRVRSGGDESRSRWSRPRMDIQFYGRTDSEAMDLLYTVEPFLKDLSRKRAVLSTGTVLIHDVTIEGGPLLFPDPDTEAPVAVGIYAPSVGEVFVNVA